MAVPTHLIFRPEHRVIICAYHRYCLRPSSVAAHFASHHARDVPTIARQAMQAQVTAMASSLHQSDADIEIPLKPIPAIDGLIVHEHSLKCRHCGHIHAGKTAADTMKAHLNTAHEIKAKRADVRGHTDTLAWWQSHWQVVQSQQFFPSCPTKGSHAASHFEVYARTHDRDAPSTPPGPSLAADAPGIDPLLSHLDRLQAEFDEAEAISAQDTAARHALVPAADARQTNPYLEHTRFQECIAGMAWSEIRPYTDPGRDRRLQFLASTVRSMVRTYNVVVSQTSRWARIRVMQESLNDVPTTPLFPYLAFDTKHAYCLVKVFVFFHQILHGGLAAPPTFALTRRQRGAWQAVATALAALDGVYPVVEVKHERALLSDMERLCHEFWLSLVEQTATGGDFELALVTPLAFLAVDTARDGFRRAYDFATDISALKKVSRFAMCQKWRDSQLGLAAPAAGMTADADAAAADVTREEAAQLIQEQEEEKDAPPSTEARNRAANDSFRRWVYEYLTEEYHTPMAWLSSTAKYISRFRYGETLDAFVRWNGPVLTCRDVSMTLEQYSNMVWRLYDEVERGLLQLAFVEKRGELLDVPWDRIQCEPSNRAIGYSPFAPTEPGLAHGRQFVLQRMKAAIAAGRHKSLVISRLDDHHRVQRYGDAVQRWLPHLMLLIQFVAGQPARLTELQSVLHENTVNNERRNLFLYAGHLAVVPRYHKGYNRDKSVKMIYRYLPRQVGALLVWYLWLIRPFYIAINQRQVTEQPTAHYLQANSSFLLPGPDGLQRRTAASLAALMKEVTARYTGREIGPNLMRHIMIAFARRMDKLRDSPIHVLSREEVSEIIDEAEDNVREAQAGHSPNTAFACYALATESPFRGQYGDPEKYLKVSRTWQDALHFDGWESDPFEALYGPSETDPKPPTRLAESISVPALFRENLGPTAKPRGKQRQVIEQVLQGEPFVAYIAPTSSGKSLAFFLPACSEGYGQTLVITPLVALRTDLHGKCDELSLTSSLFGDQHFNETARVLLAMPEHLATDDFVAMVRRRRASGRLERIVVDEYQYVLLPDHEYRPALLCLRDLVQHRTPLTLLSATIPVADEQEAHRALHLEGKVSVFRESCSRPNIHYEVESLPSHTPVTTAMLAAYVQPLRAAYPKILVFLASTAQVDELSELLGCAAYHGQLDLAARLEVQQAFLHAQRAVLVATTAFNAGVDVRDIRLVIRFGRPDHGITLSQEAGRAGRDGQPCVVRIVVGKGLYTFADKATATTRAMLDQFLQVGRSDKVCRRIALDTYLDVDGAQRTFCRPEEAACDVCARRLYAGGEEASGYVRTPRQAAPNGTPRAWTGPLASSPVRPSAATPYTTSSPALSTPRVGGHAGPRVVAGLPATPDPQAFSPLAARGSPIKRHRREVSHAGSDDAREGTHGAVQAKVARVERMLEFGEQQHRAAHMRAAEVLTQQLRATGAFWTEHCVACFADGCDFDHPKAGCAKRTHRLVQAYRGGRLGNQIGKPQCYWCLMPMSHCAKWQDAETGEVRSQADRGVDCSYAHAIPDTWAVLWDQCGPARAAWQERIRAETQGDLDGATEDGFRQYFCQMVLLENHVRVSRLAFDVNWITHAYFLGEPPSHEQLRA